MLFQQDNFEYIHIINIRMHEIQWDQSVMAEVMIWCLLLTWHYDKLMLTTIIDTI